MNKLEFLRLWDAYSALLTPTQREISGLYLNFDLTVSEIADRNSITRQAVSECLSGCKRQLEEYEQKLRFVRGNLKYGLEVSFMMTDALRWAEQMQKTHPQLSEDIERLRQILSADYSVEAEKALDSGAGTINNAANDGAKR